MPSFPDFDLYEALEVTKDASAQDITVSYRRLARLYHPDKNLDNADATAEFQKLQAAHEILSDERQRREYDLAVDSEQFSGESSQHRSQGYGEYMSQHMFSMFVRHIFTQASSRFARPEAETWCREYEARRREEEDAREREEKATREADRAAARIKRAEREAAEQARRDEETKREQAAKLKKAMEDAAIAARNEEVEKQFKLKMERIFAAKGCVTDDENGCFSVDGEIDLAFDEKGSPGSSIHCNLLLKVGDVEGGIVYSLTTFNASARKWERECW
ncbi:hypothetical protein SBOR_3358 [Sclerotinia borealis F-4128]|uniref:J domain-containing protein n=1 Tax=Sclerotinia borealis (strain F-4128) TaxID=1432307 RepID=W9CK11_SCLBF|nr:hypothetical protein SBOR_3358 [Sclerotinia borealis F-4128]